MLKGLIPSLAVLALGAVCAFGAASYLNRPDTSFEDVINASVQIDKYCSGTVIPDPNLKDGNQFTVLTAKHCLDKDQTIGSIITVNIPQLLGNDLTGDLAVKTIVYDVSKDSDVILLQGMSPDKDPQIKPVEIYGGLPAYGSSVLSISFPRGLYKVITSGYLGQIVTSHWESKELSESGRWQESTTLTEGGSSGSGLFVETDSGYQLVGTLTWGFRGSPLPGFYTPVDEVRTFLNGQG